MSQEIDELESVGHRGRIELVDEDWQMVLVIPETEEEPWRWVGMTYVQATET